MSGLNSPEAALARWFSQGITSQTHRLLQIAFDEFFQPLGIEAAALEAEPFSALESGQGEAWLRDPHWNPGRFERAHPAEPDFRFLLDRPERFAVSVDSRGHLAVGLDAAHADDPAVREILRENESGWRAARHALRAAAELDGFILAAAALLLANDPVAEIYAGGDDAAFAAAVRRRLAAASPP
jgi:hypothetical protein